VTGPESFGTVDPVPHPGLVPPSAGQRLLQRFRPDLSDAVIVAWWFAVLGLIGAVVWELVTPLAEYTRTADNGTMGEEALAQQFSATGWFIVIAAVGGVLSGVVLLLWRRRNPVLVVVLVTLGGALATLVMTQLGLVLGPANPSDVLPTVELGDKVPLQLEVEGAGVYFTWSIAALAGALGALLGFESRQEKQEREERLGFAVPRNG